MVLHWIAALIYRPIHKQHWLPPLLYGSLLWCGYKFLHPLWLQCQSLLEQQMRLMQQPAITLIAPNIPTQQARVYSEKQQLYTRGTSSAFLKVLYQKIQQHHLSLTSLKQLPLDSVTETSGRQITLEVLGTYFSIAHLITDLTQETPPVTLEQFTLQHAEQTHRVKFNARLCLSIFAN